MQALDGLQRGVVVEISRRLRDSSHTYGNEITTPSLADPLRHADVDGSIKAIVTAGNFINDLSAKMRTYEKIISSLNKTIAEHRSSEEDSYQRAVKAEARAKDAEDQIRRLELREKTALDHLDRAMRAVDTSFAFSPQRNQAARVRP